MTPKESSPAHAGMKSPDYEESVEFLRKFAPAGPWCLVAIPVDKKGLEGRTFHPGEEEQVRGWLEAHSEHNCYFGVNPVLRDVHTKPRREDIKELAWLHVDIDPRVGEDIEEERLRILKSLREFTPPPTCIIFSGGGYQAFWRLDEPFRIDGQLDLAEQAKRWNLQLELLLGGDSCHNVDRIMRLPGTINRPDAKKLKKGRSKQLAAVVDWNDRVYPLKQFTPAAEVQGAEIGFSGSVKVSDNVQRVADLNDLPVGDLCKVVIAQGCDPDDPGRWPSRSEPLFWVCCEMMRAGVADETIFAVITDPDWGISASVLELGSRAEKYAIRQIERAHAGCDELACDEEGVPYPTLRNVRLAIAKLGVTIEHDEFSDRSLVHGLEGFGPHLDDRAVNRMWLSVEETFRLKVHKDRFWTIVEDLAMRNRRHPVREYLDEVQRRWDGKPRVDRWLIDYMGAEDGEYTRAVGRIVLVAAVRRVRQPGCKFDEMPVLEGPQGTRKSMAISALAVRAAWFSDDLPLNAKPKEFIEATIGKWIVEAGELKGMRKSDVESLKSCLSRQVDRARMAYGRLPMERPRQFVMIGTTNSERYLRDNTGNRRFWPVRVGEVRLSELVADRDQLWAEAAAREARGEAIRLDEKLWAAAGEQQGKRRIEDPWLQRLEEVLTDREGTLPCEDVWRLLGAEPDRRTQDMNSRVGEAMRELGWERTRRRFGGEMRYCYVRGSGPRLQFDGIRVVKADDPGAF